MTSNGNDLSKFFGNFHAALRGWQDAHQLRACAFDDCGLVRDGANLRFLDNWKLIINTGTTIVTFLTVFVIQNSQNRDNGAVKSNSTN